MYTYTPSPSILFPPDPICSCPLNSTIIDPEGRFVIINTSINHLTFTLANVYSPKIDNPHFFHNLFSLLYNSTNLFVAGDFNTVINPLLDRTHNHSNSQIWHSSEVIKQYMTDYGLGNSWGVRNPLLREYSYVSQPTNLPQELTLAL